tara:strand:+ start:661 stop:1395 length:735 start_codon:yes stop_codon:yes gene_type:complete
MAIDVNKVYTTVLSIINKKGSGYLTPDNFNKIAKTVQLELLDRAFYEYNRAVARQTGGRGAQGYGDIPRKIQDKIDPFCTSDTISLTSGIGTLPSASSGSYNVSGVYNILNVSSTDNLTQIERIDKSKLSFLLSSPLTAPSTTFPMYYISADSIYVFPTTLTSVSMYYVGTPADPKWNSTVDTSTFGTPVYTYTSTGSQDFTLHISDEVDLILGILQYFGVIIKDPLVIQSAINESQSIINQEQ